MRVSEEVKEVEFYQADGTMCAPSIIFLKYELYTQYTPSASNADQFLRK